MATRQALAATWDVDVVGFRYAGAAMVVLGVGLPLLPHNPGLPCPLRTMTGVPCPFCGMTTAVKAGLAGHLGASIAANPFGIVAIVSAVVLIMRPRIRAVAIPAWLVFAALVVSWTWELRRFGVV